MRQIILQRDVLYSIISSSAAFYFHITRALSATRLQLIVMHISFIQSTKRCAALNFTRTVSVPIYQYLAILTKSSMDGYYGKKYQYFSRPTL